MNSLLLLIIEFDYVNIHQDLLSRNIFSTYKMRCVNWPLNETTQKTTLTSHFIRYIYQNYIKISWNTIKKIYSKESPLLSTMASRHLRNFFQAFLRIILFKMENPAIILAFSSFLVARSFVSLSLKSALHRITKGILF